MKSESGIPAVVECLYNNAPFEPGAVAVSIEAHFEKFEGYSVSEQEGVVEAQTEKDFFVYAKDELINALVLRTLSVGVALCRPFLRAYALAEVIRRGTSLSAAAYNRLRQVYQDPNFRFRVKRGATWQEFSVKDLTPPLPEYVK